MVNDINNSSAFHRAAALIVNLLRCNGFIFTEPKGMMLSEVGACNGSGLCVDLGVQALELARMTLKRARVGGNYLCCMMHRLSACPLRMQAASAAMAAVHAFMVEFVWFWDGFG